MGGGNRIYANASYESSQKEKEKKSVIVIITKARNDDTIKARMEKKLVIIFCARHS